jgi:hypothetical protein
VKSQKFRLQKLEEQLQQRQDQQPLFATTPDGYVDARVFHYKNGVTATIWYDSLNIAQEDAIQAIRPRLPTGCVLFVVPRTLPVEQWTEHFATITPGPPVLVGLMALST